MIASLLFTVCSSGAVCCQVSIYWTVYALFIEWAISQVNYVHVVSQQGYNMFVGTVMNICWVCSVKKQTILVSYYTICNVCSGTALDSSTKQSFTTRAASV